MAEVTTSTPETPAPAPVNTQPPTQPATPAGPTNGLAVAALVVGIVAVISGWVPFWGLLVGATAVVLGILALKKANGKGMAIAGIITGGLGALWGLLVAVGFIIALTLGASAVNTANETLKEQVGDSQALIDSKKDFAKGETAQFGDKFSVKVNSVERNFSPGQYYTSNEGKEYIVLNLTVKNTSDKSQYLTTLDFKVLDNGMTKPGNFAPASNKLDSGELEAGAETTGNLVYEVTAGATDLKLQYEIMTVDDSFKSKNLVYSLEI